MTYAVRSVAHPIPPHSRPATGVPWRLVQRGTVWHATVNKDAESCFMGVLQRARVDSIGPLSGSAPATDCDLAADSDFSRVRLAAQRNPD
jgi:hypothetical protein